MDSIKPMLSSKPRGFQRVNGRRVLKAIFWVLERDDFSSNHHPALSFCLSMIFFGKPVPTFPDHALTFRRGKTLRSPRVCANALIRGGGACAGSGASEAYLAIRSGTPI
jgi:hypothetical protein